MKRITAKDPDFVQGSLYVDMRDIKTGIVLAHPINQSIVGNAVLVQQPFRLHAERTNAGGVDLHPSHPCSLLATTRCRKYGTGP